MQMPSPSRRPIEWRLAQGPVAYEGAVALMEGRVAAIRAGGASDLVWLLEHPPLYTAGASARPGELLDPDRFPVYASGRGGRYTYHGPGQRVAYVMLDLKPRGQDLRRFVHDLEEWIIRALARFGVVGERRPGLVGIWVQRTGTSPAGADKIAAIGVRIRRWVSYHGIAVNLAPNLDHFQGIVPCGIAPGPGAENGVTSLAALGVAASMADLDAALAAAFGEVFGGR
jgi:lipoyl(octanoyl) transferase